MLGVQIIPKFPIILLAITSITLAQDKGPTSPLTRLPDLSPGLSAAEVAKPFQEWTNFVAKAFSNLPPQEAAGLTAAQKALAPKVPKPTKLVLYSLLPVDAANVRKSYPARADDLERLPRFHDYPILGQVTLSEPAEANGWANFFRDQIIPGSLLLCDFKPRHGIRFSKLKGGDVDFLMCYSCSQLAIFGAGKTDQKLNPVFSPATRDFLNRLFDKLKIERDVPKPPNAEAQL